MALVTLDNYTKFRGNLLKLKDKETWTKEKPVYKYNIRDLLPSKREIMKHGKLVIDQLDLENLLDALNMYASRQREYKRSGKGSFEKAPRTAFAQALEARLLSDKAKSNLTITERVKLATAAFNLRSHSYETQQALVATFRSMHKKPFYEIKYFVDSGELDLKAATDAQIMALVSGISEGTIQAYLSNNDVLTLNTRYKEITGESLYSDEDFLKYDSERSKLNELIGDSIPYAKEELLEATDVIARQTAAKDFVLRANAGRNKGKVFFD